MNIRFTKFLKNENGGTPFERLLNLFLQMLTYTKGDAAEALDWLNELDREHGITNEQYGMGDFIEDLKKKGYLKENPVNGNFDITGKSTQVIRKKALEEIFGKLRKAGAGQHKTFHSGTGDELTSDSRAYQFGDSIDTINLTSSIHNAQVNHGIDEFNLTEDDLVITEREHKTQTSTVLMIDISHSMILYGEDRITPAKKVAMAFSELIMTRYPKDTLDVLVFGDDAYPIEVKDLPFLQVGPFHTNTVAGLELAMEMLRKRKAINKQIFMITDGKPSCLKQGDRYYKNSFGLDRIIVNKCYNLAAQCKRLKIPITTFMIASDNYLQEFVREFTEINNGRAFYCAPDDLGEIMFVDYEKNRKKNIR